MIKDTTIQDINDLSLVDVIKKYVPDLQKKGANWMAKSPFTEEKTGSFSVSPTKNVWKCFSTGEGGNNAISFLMKSQNLGFVEAVRKIATDFNIEIIYDNDDAAKENIKLQEKKTTISDVNAKALEYFHNNIGKLQPQHWRFTNEETDLFSIGFATDEWKGLYQYLIGKGIAEALIFQSELVIKNEKGNIYDFFRNRIVFPIYDRQLKIVGFSGRAIDKDDKAKYINSRDTILFDKSKSFLGMDVAKEMIVKSGKATIVEGNFDVIALHKIGFNNTVAGGGTAFTDNHAKELRKLKVRKLFFVFDGDQPGINALLRSIELAISHDFVVECAVLPEGQDPFDFVKGGGTKEMLESLTRDAVEFYAEELFKDANTTVRKTTAESKLEKFLAKIKNSKLRDNYIKNLAKEHKFNATEIGKGIRAIIMADARNDEDDNQSKWRFPSYLSSEAKKEFDIHGFYEDTEPKTMGCWFGTQNYSFTKVINFLIKPLFHVVSYSNNRRLVEIQNRHGKHIVEVPSKGLVSVTPFLEVCMEKGNFQLFGTTNQFKYIANKFLDKMPMALEINTLGQQADNFWAFADGIVENSTFKEVDSYGIVNSNNTGEHYFLPAFSSIYKGLGEDDDPFESDRSFVYRNSNVDFQTWSKKYFEVHGKNGMFLISFLCATLFRDYIHSRASFFPILFGFGDVQTGKSVAARHLNAVLLGEQSPLMLNAATLVAFTRKLAQFRNAVVWADEYRNDIDERIFQGMKAAWDGAGRDKGLMTNNNKTTTTKVHSGLVVTGQYLPTRDSNALFTRAIILTFDIKAEDRTEAEVIAFDELNEMNRQGLSNVVIEILKWRDLIKKDYDNTYFDVMRDLKAQLQKNEMEFNGRVLGNYGVVLSVLKILENKLQFPFTYKQMEKEAIKLIASQSDQINESDVLNSYWKMIEYLFFNYEIESGKDFRVARESGVRRYAANKKVEMVQFKEEKKVLYIQFTKIHPKYMESHKKQEGTVGTNASSIQSYMRSSKAFLGVCPSYSFDDKRTTAWMFDYDKLDLTLERFAPHVVAENADKAAMRENSNKPIQEIKEDDDELPF